MLARHVVVRTPLSERSIIAVAELEHALRRAAYEQPLPMRSSQEKVFAQRSVISCKPLNARIGEELARIGGWRREYLISHGRLKADFYKAGVVVEVQFGKYSFCAENIFVKFPLAHIAAAAAASAVAEPMELGVLVVPTSRMAAHMSSGIGSFEQTLRNYVTPLEFQISYNLLILGLDSVPTVPTDAGRSLPACALECGDGAVQLPSSGAVE